MSDQIKILFKQAEVRDQLQRFESGYRERQNVVVVDARSAEAYRAEHMSGAINIPPRSMSGGTTSFIDKSALIVSYRDGIGCNASTKGALNLAKLGFQVKS